MAEEVSKKEALERVEDSEFGTVIVADLEPVPVIGNMDPEDMKAEVKVSTLKYGNWDIVEN